MGLVTASVVHAIQAAVDSGSSDLWLVVALALLGSSVVGGIITSAMGNLRASASVRREGYAKAVQALIARSEYPYRVRRRVSDEADVLAALVARGHDLQEQLAACRTWVYSEHRWLGTVYEDALSDIDTTVNPSTADAWDQEPVTTASGMNLAGWGPGDPWPHLRKFERAISFRFGWRRLLPSPVWRRRL